jgi:hypothetical protein
MPVTCRKCGGDHLTIKCGKEVKKEDSLPDIKPYIKPDTRQRVKQYEKREDNKEFRKPNGIMNSMKNVRKVNKPNYEKYSALITNLPDDMELINIQYMMMEWGKIGNINLRYTEDKGKMCYVDFYNKDHRDYFIKALDKTPVGFNIISISSIS